MIKYRPDIDGLRAIAVIAVIFYHSQITILDRQVFKGGFIGVDIFFVISGYLITSIILKELVSTGSFSFKYFYERRARRILPVLLFVMLVSLSFAIIYLSPSGLIDFSKSLIYSLGFSSNYYFYYTGELYGAKSGLLKPLLHTWSLSVEEQFYILFPIVLLISFKYFRKYLLSIMIFMFLISLGAAEYVSRHNIKLNFYGLPTRIWELLAGSILAHLMIINTNKKFSHLNFLLPIIGIFLIGHSIIYFDDEMRHPSIYTLSPIIGTCLIIYFFNYNQLLTKLLSSKYVVKIGLISYSLYLWHYPIFAFARNTNAVSDSFVKKILLVIILIILSIISYYLIEKPFRSKKNKFKKIILGISYVSLFLIIFCTTIILKDGFKNKYRSIYFKNNIFNEELQKNSWKLVEKQSNVFDENGKINVLIIGDSHSKDLFNSFELNKDLFKQYNFIRYGNNKDIKALHFDRNMNDEMLFKFQKSKLYQKSDIILISDYFLEDSFDKLEQFIIFFKNKKKLILTSNSNLYKNLFKHKKYYNLTLFDYYLIKNSQSLFQIDKNLNEKKRLLINKYYFNNRDEEQTNNINKNLKLIADKYNIELIYKQIYQCKKDSKICYGVTNDGFKIFFDYGHYTLEGAKFFGKIIHNLDWFNPKLNIN